MRRGHQGIGGWRNDNPRHFRPRGGGAPHFRPGRGFGHGDTSRFPPPGSGPRLLIPHLYGHNLQSNNHMPLEYQDRSYRDNRQNNQHRSQDRGPTYPHNQEHRQIFPKLLRARRRVPDRNTYQENQKFYENKKCLINSMGDMDHRRSAFESNQESYKQHISPWVNPPMFEDRSPPSKHFRHQDDHNQSSQADYAGHRPPASDHYGGNHSSIMENSNTFSRSVDDTVNIVRKRLLTRESQHPSEEEPLNQDEAETSEEPTTSTYSNIRQEQPTKKKSHRIKNIKKNCDKIKNKIVHQLFMMDKDKIHKLMDNPNSSTKFEYAISSLITESQNSFNRHLRSAAEKSLSGASTDFIHNDNNTIYEDTFMKQMQCLLDPQDTVLLEDIKPMVLAELSKVLQLHDFEQQTDIDETAFFRDDSNQYPNDRYDNYLSFSPNHDHENYYEQKPQANYERCQSPGYERPQKPVFEKESNLEYQGSRQDFEVPLFERRKPKKAEDYIYQRRCSSELRRQDRKSVESRSEDSYRRSTTPTPLFDPNTEQMSDEDDPFAELDKQYHVAVDHNFIENYDDINSPQESVLSHMSQPPQCRNEICATIPLPERPQKVKSPIVSTPKKPTSKIKEEIDSQLQDMAKSPFKFINTAKAEPEMSTKNTDTERTKELLIDSYEKNMTALSELSDTMETKTQDNNSANQEPSPKPQLVETVVEKTEDQSSLIKMSASSYSRKRSTDQKPLHRKEKRKKIESSQLDTNKQILNKNIIINVNDCAAKASEKCDAPKSIFNLFFSKEKSSKELSKDIKKVDFSEKGYSDKYVKRKESSSKKLKERDKDSEVKKKNDSSFSSHSISNSSDMTIQTPTKTDGQVKLKPINMFVDLPKKPTAHQAHRNTAPIVPTKSIVETKPIVISHKACKRHIATQVVKKCFPKETQTIESKNSSSRFCQTERKKLITRGSQTEPVSFKASSKSTEPFERMKEIDMEIQVLLQEKFKLYNSIETKESCSSTMQSLGMAVLSVAPDIQNETIDAEEDTIVDDFTNIPLEELEQIVMESAVQEEQDQDTAATHNKDRRRKESEREKKTSLNLGDEFTDIPVTESQEIAIKPVEEGKTKNTAAKNKNRRPTVSKRERNTSLSFVDEFTSIPAEELDLIAIESVQKEKKQNSPAKNKHCQQKELERKTPLSRAISLVDEFTSIPAEEFELIAMESVQREKKQNSSAKNKRSHQKDLERKAPLSPVKGLVDKLNSIPAEELELIAMESVQKEKKQNSSAKNKRSRQKELEKKAPLSPIISLVDEFTSIPAEELKLIAMESVQKEKKQNSTAKNKRSRQKELERKPPLSPVINTSNMQRKGKVKAPNISLIEQIITDDRPLEDIISLDDLESSPSEKAPRKTQSTPKKKVTKKKVTKPDKKLLECSVVIKREDLNKLLKKFKAAAHAKTVTDPNVEMFPKTKNLEDEALIDLTEPASATETHETVVEESIVNDMQIDMLDVSEDIIIGDVCEIKLDKIDSSVSSVSEEIILDNSQSSIDDTAGQEGSSNECKTFDYSSDENLRRESITVSGNGDAVLAIECIGNNFITACLDGNVYYFSGNGQLISTLRGSNLAVTCLTIVKEKYGTTVYTGSLDSRIRYYDLETGIEKGPECNVLSPIQTMDRAWDTVFVGTRTGFVLQFECKNNMLIPISTVKFSDQSILALRAMKEGPRKVLLVAARSEQVTIKDAQTGLLLRTLEGPKMTVYSLLFEDGKVYCGTSSHQIHVFDYSSGTHVGSHEGGKGAVCLRATGGLVFAGCYDGCVYVYKEGTPTAIAQLRGPSLMLLSLAVQETKIIAGYKDRSLYIWKIPNSILQEMIL